MYSTPEDDFRRHLQTLQREIAGLQGEAHYREPYEINGRLEKLCSWRDVLRHQLQYFEINVLALLDDMFLVELALDKVREVLQARDRTVWARVKRGWRRAWGALIDIFRGGRPRLSGPSDRPLLE